MVHIKFSKEQEQQLKVATKLLGNEIDTSSIKLNESLKITEAPLESNQDAVIKKRKIKEPIDMDPTPNKKLIVKKEKRIKHNSSLVSKENKILLDSDLIKSLKQILWDLSSSLETERKPLIQKALQEIYSSDIKEEEINYLIKRLIKGMESSNQTARIGYSILFKQLLNYSNKINVNFLIGLLFVKRSFISKEDKRNFLIGHNLALKCTLQTIKLCEENSQIIFKRVWDFKSNGFFDKLINQNLCTLIGLLPNNKESYILDLVEIWTNRQSLKFFDEVELLLKVCLKYPEFYQRIQFFNSIEKLHTPLISKRPFDFFLLHEGVVSLFNMMSSEEPPKFLDIWKSQFREFIEGLLKKVEVNHHLVLIQIINALLGTTQKEFVLGLLLKNLTVLKPLCYKPLLYPSELTTFSKQIFEKVKSIETKDLLKFYFHGFCYAIQYEKEIFFFTEFNALLVNSDEEFVTNMFKDKIISILKSKYSINKQVRVFGGLVRKLKEFSMDFSKIYFWLITLLNIDKFSSISKDGFLNINGSSFKLVKIGKEIRNEIQYQLFSLLLTSNDPTITMMLNFMMQIYFNIKIESFKLVDKIVLSWVLISDLIESDKSLLNGCLAFLNKEYSLNIQEFKDKEVGLESVLELLIDSCFEIKEYQPLSHINLNFFKKIMQSYPIGLELFLELNKKLMSYFQAMEDVKDSNDESMMDDDSETMSDDSMDNNEETIQAIDNINTEDKDSDLESLNDEEMAKYDKHIENILKLKNKKKSNGTDNRKIEVLLVSLIELVQIQFFSENKLDLCLEYFSALLTTLNSLNDEKWGLFVSNKVSKLILAIKKKVKETLKPENKKLVLEVIKLLKSSLIDFSCLFWPLFQFLVEDFNTELVELFDDLVEFSPPYFGKNQTLWNLFVLKTFSEKGQLPADNSNLKKMMYYFPWIELLIKEVQDSKTMEEWSFLLFKLLKEVSEGEINKVKKNMLENVLDCLLLLKEKYQFKPTNNLPLLQYFESKKMRPLKPKVQLLLK